MVQTFILFPYPLYLHWRPPCLGHTRRTLVVQSTLGTRLNPALYSEYLRKEHERYERRKEVGSIKLVHDMTNTEKRHARKSWRQRKQRLLQRSWQAENKITVKPREADRYRKQLERIEKRTQYIDSPRSKTRNLFQGKKVSNAARRSLLFYNVLIMDWEKNTNRRKQTDRSNNLTIFLSNLFLRSTD